MERREFESDFDVALPAEVVVLSTHDFQAALARASLSEAGRGALLAPLEKRRLAASLAAMANSPEGLGLSAKRLDSDATFRGSVFLVADDLTVDALTGELRATSFRVASVALGGIAKTAGRGAVLHFTGPLGGESGRCCGPSTICVPNDAGPEPTPGCDIALCTGGGIGVSPNAPPTGDSRGNAGLVTIPLTVYGRTSLGGLEGFDFDCTAVHDRECDRVTPICDVGDIGFTENDDGGGDPGSGSNPCAPGRGSPAMGRNVPEICTYISGWDQLPAECGGWCEDCNTPPSTRHELPPGCTVARTTPDSDVCQPMTPERQAIRQAEMRLTAGWIPGQESTSCTPTHRGGIEVCTTCDAAGNCGEYARRSPVNPQAEEGGDCGEYGCDEHGKRVNPDGWWHHKPDNFSAPEPGEVEPVTPGGGGSSNDPHTPGSDDPGSTPSPDPDPEPPKNTGGDLEPFVQEPHKAGDPISLGNGGFRLDQRDLSFEGPVRALVFRRFYDSTLDERTTLGSNWRHEWDVSISPVTEDTAPSWLSPYSLGSPESPTCVVLHEGDGSKAFFHLDLDTRLFVPQAGSFETLSRTAQNAGWALRTPDGAIRYFDEHGCLTADRDRFGNGFRVEYEATPLFELYQYFCSSSALAARNETKYAARSALLAYLVGDGSEPASGDLAWSIVEADLPIPPQLAVSDPTLNARLLYARAYLLYLASRGYGVRTSHGTQRRRVVKVVDDLGRALEFRYRLAAPLPVGNPLRFDFANTPDAELLLEVRGPLQTRVRFRYARPTGYPTALNETFLVGVARDDAAAARDVVSAVPWSCEFTYQWPGVLSADYGRYRSAVYDAWHEYYKTFVGCAYQDVVPCSGGAAAVVAGTRFALGDPEALARKAEWDYVSSVADNIVTVVRNGIVESETRFGIDPWSDEFDHAVAQRYGSSSTVDPPTTLPPDDPAFEWTTDLPRIALSYCDSGPSAVGGDKTDAFLPRILRARYPLETAPPTESEDPPAPVTSTPQGGAFVTCDYDEMRLQEQRLPYFRETIKYYRPTASETHPNLSLRLFRTHLTPNQLAGAQLGDPTHNDLLSSLEPDPASTDRHDRIVERIVGRRQWIAANANRICRWVRFVNRDGDLTYFGLNYRGQWLVEAVTERDSGTMRFAERLYNADGNLVQARRAMRGATAWSSAIGYTAYTYDEINPDGSDGWNAWLPVFWSRRGNVLRIEERASGVGAMNRDEHSEKLTTTVGRYTRWRYEPLFNQVQTVIEGSIELAPPRRILPAALELTRERPTQLDLIPVDSPHSKVAHTFDYQELSWDVPATDATSIRPVLEALQPWGFFWFRNTAGELDAEAIASWQLPLPLFGVDLNGDGIVGFDAEPGNARRARGVIISTRRGGPSSSPSDVVTFFTWAPHGRLAGIRGPDGDVSTYEYYSAVSTATPAAKYGSNAQPTDADCDANFRGFLARARVRRYAPSHPTTLGPPDAPCPALPGPYQWLLPTTVTAEPRQALLAAGFSQEMADAIVEASSGIADWVTRSFSYNEGGGVRREWDDYGVQTAVRDIDGRPTLTVDARGKTTRVEYTADGWAQSEIVTNRRGDRVGEVWRAFDETGALTYECHARSLGGAQPLGSATPADGSVVRLQYYPEGEVATVTDPGGTITQYKYDDRGLTTHQRWSAPGFARPRGTSYRYTADGDLASVVQGDPDGDHRGLTLEQFAYDGLRRPLKRTDPRGFSWHVAHSARDLLVAERRSDAAYGVTPPAGTWERSYAYDVVRRLTEDRINGTVITRNAYSVGGHVCRASSDGRGTTYTTYDLEGNPAWKREPNGLETVHVKRLRPNRVLAATLRGAGADRRIEEIVRELDDAGDARVHRQWTRGIELRTTFTRDHEGRVLRAVYPDSNTQEWSYNWLGWTMTHRVLRERGGTTWDLTRWEYNARGQATVVIDPANQRTNVGYDAMGEMTSWQAPGCLRFYRYDVLGRVEWSRYGAVEVQHEWDANSNAIGELVNEQGTWQRLTRRAYDDRDRLVRAESTNYALSWLPSDERRCLTTYGWDALDRLERHTTRWGTGALRELRAQWTLASEVWERQVRHTAGHATSEWLAVYDRSERLTRKTNIIQGRWGNSIDFLWNNDLYAGRVQQVGTRSPIREVRGFDPFSRLSTLSYRAIDVTALGAPVDAAEGRTYCGGTWDSAQCATPLLDIDVRRELLGRIASLQWTFGHPRIQNGALIRTNRPSPWRGYAYTLRRALKGSWEHTGATLGIDPSALAPYRMSEADIALLGASADFWAYDREGPVGGTLDIANANRGSRWRLTAPRATGHRLQQLDLSGTNLSVQHDSAGRVVQSGAFGFVYDAESRLSAVTKNGLLVEAYGYDGTGRLAALIGPAGDATTFLHDGDHILTATDATLGDLRWEATWGATLDHLVLWRSPSVRGALVPILDHAGSVVAAWNALDQRMVETCDYSPEGVKVVRDAAQSPSCSDKDLNTVCAPPGDLPFGFFGAFQGPATGLLYLRNRWYAPALGQFLTQDPLGYVDGFNAYAFGSWDPINNRDPYGLDSGGPARPDPIPEPEIRGTKGGDAVEKPKTPPMPGKKPPKKQSVLVVKMHEVRIVKPGEPIPPFPPLDDPGWKEIARIELKSNELPPKAPLKKALEKALEKDRDWDVGEAYDLVRRRQPDGGVGGQTLLRPSKAPGKHDGGAGVADPTQSPVTPGEPVIRYIPPPKGPRTPKTKPRDAGIPDAGAPDGGR